MLIYIGIAVGGAVIIGALAFVVTVSGLFQRRRHMRVDSASDEYARSALLSTPRPAGRPPAPSSQAAEPSEAGAAPDSDAARELTAEPEIAAWGEKAAPDALGPSSASATSDARYRRARVVSVSEDAYALEAAEYDEYGSHSAHDSASMDRYLVESVENLSLNVVSGRALFGGYGTPPGVPLGDREGPLPHDGLFIRRNNAFGTRSVVGIADLIEQGVLIGQEQIRFDDFVASRSGEIPAPPDGAAVAVSHGRANGIPGCTAKNSTTHFLEIALRAADAPAGGGGQAAPLPVNFVFVVDVSGSMEGEKLASVKASLRELYEQLRDDDVLGVITFDTQPRTILKATRKADLARDRLLRAVDDLRAYGGTDLNLGVLYGIDEIARHAGTGPGMVNCLYLFSDGDPTSGVTNWIQIRSNIAERLRGDLTLSCFGFGADAQIRELEALVGLTGGNCTLVTRPEDVRLNLSADLARREHLAAINIQLQIQLNPRIGIWHLYGHDLITDPARRAAVLRDAADARRRGQEEFGVVSAPDLITRDDGIRIFAPDLAFGETYWIVFEVETPAGLEADDLGQATVQYVDTVARQPVRHELTLSPVGAIPDSAVAVHAIGLWTSEVTFYALDDLYANDRATAKERLTRHISTLEFMHKSVPAPEFLDDQVTFRKFISLSGNLGSPVNFFDASAAGGGPFGYTTFMLSSFGQIRSGYHRLPYRQ